MNHRLKSLYLKFKTFGSKPLYQLKNTSCKLLLDRNKTDEVNPLTNVPSELYLTQPDLT